MPTAIATERGLSARSIGPAVPARDHTFIVHSVFSAALNLRLDGYDLLATLTGPAGAGLPQAVSLGSAVDFRGLSVPPGSRGEWRGGFIRLEGREGRVVIDCGLARRRGVGVLPAIEVVGEAFDLCVEELARTQERGGVDLRISALLGKAAPATPSAVALVRAAKSLGAWASSAVLGQGGSEEEEGPGRSVARLVGLGEGLTPSGDDFLSGFTAALRAARPGFEGDRDDFRAAAVHALCETIEASAAATNEISASLLRGAARGFYPESLLAAASGMARDEVALALSSLEETVAIGHSSGADMMTGLLYGLALLIRGTGGAGARHKGKRSLYAT